MSDSNPTTGVDNGATAADDKPIPTPGFDQGAQDVTAESSKAPADAAAKEPKEDGEDKPQKSGGGFQKRIAELTRRASEAERDRERLLTLLERNTPSGAPQHKSENDGPPRPDQFKTYEEYIDARADWRADQRVKEALKGANAETQQRQAEESFGTRVSAFNDAVAKEGKDIEGFEDAHQALLTPVEEGGPEVHPLMADFLMSEAENRALMVKYLGENPDEATKLSRLHPRTMVNRLARLDAQLGVKPAAKRSNAPPPPPTVNGRSAPQVDGMKLDIDEYAKRRGFA